MNCKRQNVYKGMKIGYIFIILLLLVACKPYADYYCCPIKPLYTAISSLNPAEIGMISSYFKFQAPH